MIGGFVNLPSRNRGLRLDQVQANRYQRLLCAFGLTAVPTGNGAQICVNVCDLQFETIIHVAPILEAITHERGDLRLVFRESRL